ncbi:GntR family transcriptional regulator [Collinsella sp. AGMB00827]|uniref:GntR family transcriptional regulator n=1 Tax=Collinsella ureilytica TaxID=2869515 RepID=A0ABS7MLX1_9ACTN|nr:GntR family transcriptional regulator [Collinsella urealyticum]MBY4798372.1 GntR family transcriptional regulator [Collinsella urealyticum]
MGVAPAELSNSVQLHIQAANYMRERIYDHLWEPDDQIPTEHELCEILGMSRGTVRRAIRALVDENLLVQIRGKGTFVSRTVFTHPTGSTLISFAESLRSQGVSFTTRVVKHEVVPADERLASKLFLKVGDPVLTMDRVRSVEGKPVLLLQSCINLKVLPGLEKIDFNTHTLFATIESMFGKRIGHSNARYAACVAGEERGELLHVGPDSPVLHLEQQIFLTDNTSAEWSNVWLIANNYVVGTVLQRI